MSNSTLNVDPRIIPLVRSLKEHPTDTMVNSSKMKLLQEVNKIENEKNKNDEIKKSKINKKNIRLPNKSNTIIRRKSSTKISIDGSVDNQIKSGTQDSKRPNANSMKKINILSKTKENKVKPINTFHFNSGTQISRKYNHNNLKTKSKYVQNLLSDMSIKKYKQNCIDILKNDNLVKKLYEQAGFEKSNFSYENFISNKFFNQQLFMYKLEMLFLDESNFIKKNFKENFFKNEIIKYLNQYMNEEKYKKQMNNLKDIFQQEFNTISNFDLFHD